MPTLSDSPRPAMGMVTVSSSRRSSLGRQPGGLVAEDDGGGPGEVGLVVGLPARRPRGHAAQPPLAQRRQHVLRLPSCDHTDVEQRSSRRPDALRVVDVDRAVTADYPAHPRRLRRCAAPCPGCRDRGRRRTPPPGRRPAGRSRGDVDVGGDGQHRLGRHRARHPFEHAGAEVGGPDPGGQGPLDRRVDAPPWSPRRRQVERLDGRARVEGGVEDLQRVDHEGPLRLPRPCAAAPACAAAGPACA